MALSVSSKESIYQHIIFNFSVSYRLHDQQQIGGGGAVSISDKDVGKDRKSITARITIAVTTTVITTVGATATGNANDSVSDNNSA